MSHGDPMGTAIVSIMFPLAAIGSVKESFDNGMQIATNGADLETVATAAGYFLTATAFAGISAGMLGLRDIAYRNMAVPMVYAGATVGGIASTVASVAPPIIDYLV